jgi:UDP-N-acetylglucosamine:LPS N-acetylglucosamine transferase
VQVHFVSYGTGARTIEKFGYPLIDLDLPEDNGIAETTVLAGRLIGWLQPDLVVSHEEFPVFPAAKIFDLPTIAILDWFTDFDKYSMRSLEFADDILFLDDTGIWDEPPWAAGKVHYLGPFVREFEYSRADRLRARRELNLPEDALVICVAPGSWTEKQAPLVELVAAAFDDLPAPRQLVWIAGADQETIAARFQGRPDVQVLSEDWQIDRLMVASDAAITRCTRKTLHELEALGVPSVSVCYGHNPIDERRAAKLSMTRVISPQESLAAALHERLSAPAGPGVSNRASPRRTAQELTRLLDALPAQR